MARKSIRALVTATIITPAVTAAAPASALVSTHHLSVAATEASGDVVRLKQALFTLTLREKLRIAGERVQLERAAASETAHAPLTPNPCAKQNANGAINKPMCREKSAVTGAQMQTTAAGALTPPPPAGAAHRPASVNCNTASANCTAGGVQNAQITKGTAPAVNCPDVKPHSTPPMTQ
jgi:hypothetical protein